MSIVEQVEQNVLVSKVSDIFLYILLIQILESQINYKFVQNGILSYKKDNPKLERVSDDDFQLILQYVSNFILLKLLNEQALIPIYIPFNSNNSKDSSLEQCIALVSKDFEKNEKLLIMIQM